jgi:hypothetical protein
MVVCVYVGVGGTECVGGSGCVNVWQWRIIIEVDGMHDDGKHE